MSQSENDVQYEYAILNDRMDKPIVRRWRCTRGHEYEATHAAVMGLGVDGLFEGTEWFCLGCIRDWAKEYCGRVREVK